MAIDVHHLINQPGYGNAEKALRRAGAWRKTNDEVIISLLHKLNDAVDEITDAANDIENYTGDIIMAMEATT